MTLTTMRRTLDELTAAALVLLTEIRKGDYQTLPYAIADFEDVNARRIELMTLLNLVPRS